MRILRVSSRLLGVTTILLRELARAEFLADISRNFWSSMMRIMRILPASSTGTSILAISTEPGPSSKKRCALSRQRMMFLAE